MTDSAGATRLSLDVATLQSWFTVAQGALNARQAEIDALNVFPVPDGDTGANLCATWVSLLAHAEPAPDSPRALLESAARGAVLGARGNSGVILSQLLQGLAVACPEHSDTVPAGSLVRGFGEGVRLAYAAVAEPVEGTMLSVALGAAAGAADADPGDLVAVCRAASSAAASALAATPSQLPALERAGVVDAGGLGWVVVLDSLLAVVTGHEVAPILAAVTLAPTSPGVADEAAHCGPAEPAYEVQYLLGESEPDAVDRLRERLGELGDSVAVVGVGSTWNVHAHVDDIGAAIEAGMAAGRPYDIRVTRFADRPGVAGTGRGLVVVASGPGLANLFRAEGVEVVDVGPTFSPSTADFLAAIERTGCREVVVLPADPNALSSAAQAATVLRERDPGRLVAVLPAKSTVQALAAVAVSDPARNFSEDVIAMSAAVGSTRWAEVTLAVREALTSAGICRAGDVLGLLEGDVVLIGEDLEETATALLDRMLHGGGELVTLVTGRDCPIGLTERLDVHARRSHPGVDVVTYAGGQPLYPLLLGVE